MEIKYKREVNDSYFILEEKDPLTDDMLLKEEEKKNIDFHFRMITENSIKGLLHVNRQNFNGENQIYYKISGCQSMKEVYEKKQMQVDDLIHLLLTLNDLLKTLEDYLLDSSFLILTPEFIYVSSLKKEIAFCLYPFEKKDIKKQIRSLCEYFLNHINHEDDKVVSIAYQLYRLTRDDNFEFDGIVKELLMEEHHFQGESQPMQIPADNTVNHIGQVNIAEESIIDKNQLNMEEPGENMYMSDTHGKSSLISASETDPKSAIPVFKIFSVCLMIGSLLNFLYIYFVNSYFYGYSFLRIITMKEAIISFSLFISLAVVIWIYSFLLPRKKLWKFKK